MFKTKRQVLDTLIEAMQIALKYVDASTRYPVHCEFNEFWLVIDPMVVSTKDSDRLEELGFEISGDAFILYE